MIGRPPGIFSDGLTVLESSSFLQASITRRHECRTEPAAHHHPVPEREIAAQFAQAVARGYLGEQFFYGLPLSLEAWVALCRSPEYRNASRAFTLLSRAAPHLAKLWPGVDTLCGLGCGEGSSFP